MKEWLEGAVASNKINLFSIWGKDFDIYVELALKGLDQGLINSLDDPFLCLMFTHINKHCLELANIFPPPELLILGWRKIMKMPPWAIPGVLTAALHIELSKGTHQIRLKPLIYLTTKYYKNIFSRFDAPFANFHQTIIQALLFERLYKLTKNSFYLDIVKRSWWLIDSLVEPSGYVTRFRLPVWDTAWSLLALKDMTTEKGTTRELLSYLINTQQSDNGWAYTHIKHPSDNDTTSLVLLALLDMNAVVNVENVIDFLLSNQRNDGGWSAYGKGNKDKPKGAIPSIKANPWWTQFDVPTADVTSHVLFALSKYYKKLKDAL